MMKMYAVRTNTSSYMKELLRSPIAHSSSRVDKGPSQHRVANTADTRRTHVEPDLADNLNPFRFEKFTPGETHLAHDSNH